MSGYIIETIGEIYFETTNKPKARYKIAICGNVEFFHSL